MRYFSQFNMKLGRISQQMGPRMLWARKGPWCITGTCLNVRHTGGQVHPMHVSGLEENPRHNGKALVILRNQIEQGGNGWGIGELGKIPKWVKIWLTLHNCHAMLRAQNQELLELSLIFFFLMLHRQRSWWRRWLWGKRARNISESKSRHWKSFRNTLTNIFQVYFPFYLCTRVIYGKINV